MSTIKYILVEVLKINVLIIGCGAVGLAIGASLISQDISVSFYASEKTATTLNKNGIKRIGLFEHLSVNPDKFKTYTNYTQLPKNTFNYILIATKTTTNEEIAQKLYQYRNIMCENAKIILFQNGFGYDEEFLKYFKEDTVYSSAILTGFKRHNKYISEITGHTHPLMIGSLHTETREVEICNLLTKSGFPSQSTSSIEKDLWAKMLFNCALNPLSAILNVKYGQLSENEYSMKIIDNLIDETFKVMKKAGYTTNWENVENYKEIFYNQFFPDGYNHKSSMLMDINNKKKTEIDTLNGKIVKIADELNINVPTTKTIVNLIKSIESQF